MSRPTVRCVVTCAWLSLITCATFAGTAPGGAQQDADELVRKAHTLWSKSDFTRAKSALDAAIEKVPDHAGALAFLCTMSMAKAQMDARAFTTAETVRARDLEAAEACGHAAELGIAPPPGISFLALQARARAGASDWTGAVAAYEAWVASAPEDGRLAGGYAAMLDRAGRADESSAVLARAAARSSEFDHAARVAFVWDRFALDDAERLRPILATLIREESDPKRRLVLETLSSALDGKLVDTQSKFLDVVEGDFLPRPELDHLWDAVFANVRVVDPKLPSSRSLELDMKGVELPRLLNAVAPKYPVMADRGRVEGKVILLARINVDGSVHPVFVFKETARVFAQPAEDAVLARRYAPATLDGKPIAIPFTIRVDFRQR